MRNAHYWDDAGRRLVLSDVEHIRLDWTIQVTHTGETKLTQEDTQ